MKFAALALVSLCFTASSPAFAEGLDGLYQGSIFGQQTSYGISAEFRTIYQPMENPMTIRPFIMGNLTLNIPNTPNMNFSFADANYNPMLGKLVFYIDSFVGEHTVVVNCDVKERTLLGCKWQSLLTGESYDFSLAKQVANPAIAADKLAGQYTGKLITDTAEYDLAATLNPMLVQREAGGEPQPAVLGQLSYTNSKSKDAIKTTLAIADGIYDASSGQLALQLSSAQIKPAILASCRASAESNVLALKCTWQSLVNGKKFDFLLIQQR